MEKSGCDYRYHLRSFTHLTIRSLLSRFNRKVVSACLPRIVEYNGQQSCRTDRETFFVGGSLARHIFIILYRHIKQHNSRDGHVSRQYTHDSLMARGRRAAEAAFSQKNSANREYRTNDWRYAGNYRDFLGRLGDGSSFIFLLTARR